MGKLSGNNFRLYLGGYDLSPLASGNEINLEDESLSYAVADGVNGYHHIRGLSKDSFKLDGLFDDNYMGIINTLHSTDTDKGVMIPLGSSVGSPCYCCDPVKMTKSPWITVVKDINKLSAEFNANGRAFDECVLLQANATKTVDGNGTILDNGAATSNGLAAYLQVFAYSGDASGIYIAVKHSADNFVSEDVELINFNDFLSPAHNPDGVMAIRATVTGTIKQYLRVTWGGVAGYSSTFAVAVKRL
jgi:hypothetical protein